MPLSQDNRPLKVTTPLGPNAFVLTNFSAREGLSQLFQYYVEMVAPNDTDVKFEGLLGQKVTVEIAVQKQSRFFNGIVSRISQGTRDGTVTIYRAEVVPQLWLLTRKWQSRIFQHMNVQDILKKVLSGMDTAFELTGTFEPRDYCVQYRETDFNFASRLMEEEGIYYYFKHTDAGHKMVLADTPQSHADVPGPTTIHFDETAGGDRPDLRIISWTKIQEMRSGKCTLWDHSFELPHKHLEADKTTQDTVQVGKVSHSLKVGGNDKLEIYDFPGEYAQRFDGIDKGGGEQPDELKKIFTDNKRTVGIRMQQEAMPTIEISGSGNAPQMLAGHKFTLDRHFNADGQYVINTVLHGARQMSYTNTDENFQYSNSFTCLPLELPYRPPRSSPRPVVQGTQTAVVVGPAGEEIFTDKYGRVKVQFHWDRDGKNNIDSSCWARVSTLWAGKQWGMIHIPRIGQEVIVDFLEGDPDQPIVVGSVYNADMMPPYKLPDNKTQSGIKTRSSLKGDQQNFNELRFEDKKGEEQVYIHAERNQDIHVEKDETHFVGHDRKKEITNDERVSVGHDRTESVGHDENISIDNDRTENVTRNEKISIGGNRNTDVGKNEEISVGENRTESVNKDEKITIGGNREESVGKDEKLEVTGNRFDQIGKDDKQQVGQKFALVAGDEILLQTGDASILMKSNGEIQIKGKDITIVGSGKIAAKASSDMVLKGSKIAAN